MKRSQIKHRNICSEVIKIYYTDLVVGIGSGGGWEENGRGR
jgi:hypothetical protein